MTRRKVLSKFGPWGARIDVAHREYVSSLSRGWLCAQLARTWACTHQRSGERSMVRVATRVWRNGERNSGGRLRTRR